MNEPTTDEVKARAEIFYDAIMKAYQKVAWKNKEKQENIPAKMVIVIGLGEGGEMQITNMGTCALFEKLVIYETLLRNVKIEIAKNSFARRWEL